ncbi:hypothetical protein GSI_10231 [Ganoderma sinense ZZ0214-1]|uniref:Uncharacterized protein n=1 Tax=Ganoderma sinense ZZ0214-1 TaxID=1077348 RepID=A0A2G8RZZ8_9APHY|nr:hypothetical protein GSI_10231 [Ganoderma sinense ZZ0214-1]
MHRRADHTCALSPCRIPPFLASGAHSDGDGRPKRDTDSPSLKIWRRGPGRGSAAASRSRVRSPSSTPKRCREHIWRWQRTRPRSLDVVSCLPSRGGAGPGCGSAARREAQVLAARPPLLQKACRSGGREDAEEPARGRYACRCWSRGGGPVLGGCVRAGWTR